MSDWGILDDSSVSSNGDVEYVGMSDDDDDVPPVRVPRRPVRRAMRPARRASQASIPAYGPATHPMKPGRDNMYHMPTTTGAEVAMNAEAIQNMRSGGVHDIGGRTALRVQPGTYVTYGPGRGPSGHPGIGMGGMGDFDAGAFVQGLMTGAGTLVTSITEGVATVRQQRSEAELAEAALRLERETAAAAREIAMMEAEQGHEERMAQIEQARAELAELQRAQAQVQREQEQYAATSSALPASGAGGGVSPVVWILLAVVGLGGVGTLVWLLTKDKGKEK